MVKVQATDVLRILPWVLLPVLGGVGVWAGTLFGGCFSPQAPASQRRRRTAYLQTFLSAFHAILAIVAFTRTPATALAGTVHAIVVLCAAPLAWGISLACIAQVKGLPREDRELEWDVLKWYHRVMVFGPLAVAFVAILLARFR